MALCYPAGVVGTHVSTAEMMPYTGPGAALVSPVDRAYKHARKAYLGED